MFDGRDLTHVNVSLLARSDTPVAQASILAFAAARIAWHSSSADDRQSAAEYYNVGLQCLHAPPSDSHRSEPITAAVVLLKWSAPDLSAWSELCTLHDVYRMRSSAMKLPLMHADLLDQACNSPPAVIRNDPDRRWIRECQSFGHILFHLMPRLTHDGGPQATICQMAHNALHAAVHGPPDNIIDRFKYLARMRDCMLWLPERLLMSGVWSSVKELVLCYSWAVIIATEAAYPMEQGYISIDTAVGMLAEGHQRLAISLPAWTRQRQDVRSFLAFLSKMSSSFSRRPLEERKSSQRKVLHRSHSEASCRETKFELLAPAQ